ncbi:Transmembrane osmosensor [Terramyces sp. JEL0728]|nr:Transmembrane osmosensor [Terramyces sp. JEL0728]
MEEYKASRKLVSSMDLFKEQPKYSICIAVSLIATLLNFLGICIAQSALPFEKVNPLGLGWYFFFVYLLWALLLGSTIYFKTFATYKALLTQVTTLALTFLPFDLNGSLQGSTSHDNATAAGNGIRAAALVILVFPLIAVFILLGSGEKSFVHTDIIPNFEIQRREKVASVISPPSPELPKIPVEKLNDTMYSEIKVNIPDATLNSTTVDTLNKANSQVSTIPRRRYANVRNSKIRDEDMVIEFKAKALYSYTANEDDPHEVSFDENEIFEIVESSGKWWQIVKLEKDGTFTVGIAPSNYLQKSKLTVKDLMETFQKAPRLFLALFVAELGWLLDFIGVAVAQSDLSYSKYNPLGLQWYFLFAYLAFIILLTLTIYTDSLKTYKGLLVNLNTLTLAFLPFDIDNAINVAYLAPASNLAGGSSTRIAGLIIMVFPMIAIAAMLGSEENSFVNTFDLGFIPAPKVNNAQAKDTIAVVIERVEPEAPSVPPSELIVIPTPVARNSVIKHESLITKFKAKALYSYKASQSDPNEISFQAGEVLEIIDSEGRWWQVVKTEADGTFTTGIAPSNYMEKI